MIIDGCARGDRKAQRELYDLFSKKLLVVALRYCKSQLEAEDVLQEAFIKIFRSIKSFEGKAKLETWMRKILVNTALNHQRSKLYLFPMSDVYEMQMPDAGDIPIREYHFTELLKMIQELPTGCQVIFNLYAIEGYNHNEIAKKLDISVGTSKSQYARAKMLLREMIEKAESVNYGQA